ncbi:hypothetical protein [Paenibacillus sp. FSL K6-1230]|uniref:hypothetical protein n=1 Tax=Paenibacillus sp. FSL K6-1230 TaxID=2921603 RepID=UPI00039B9B3E
MQFTDQGILNVTLEDISGLYAYRDRDGVAFADGLAFELKLQRIELTPGSVRGVELQFGSAELVYPEDYAELQEAVYAVVRQTDPEFHG